MQVKLLKKMANISNYLNYLKYAILFPGVITRLLFDIKDNVVNRQRVKRSTIDVNNLIKSLK